MAEQKGGTISKNTHEPEGRDTILQNSFAFCKTISRIAFIFQSFWNNIVEMLDS